MDSLLLGLTEIAGSYNNRYLTVKSQGGVTTMMKMNLQLFAHKKRELVLQRNGRDSESKRFRCEKEQTDSL